jgi:hypothetical protein
VTGTPVNFGGMTGRALAVNLKLIFENRAIKKKVFLLAPRGTTLWSTLYYAVGKLEKLPKAPIFPIPTQTKI